MDTGGIAKPPAATASTAPARAGGLQSARGVGTELPAETAVQQMRESEAVRFDPLRLAPGAALDATLSEFIRQKVEIDPETQEVIFQVVDQQTGRVLRQSPDEAILRMRAYAREVQAAEDGGHDGVARVVKIA